MKGVYHRMDRMSIPQNMYAMADPDLPVEDGWQIDSPKAAEWTIRKIKEARAQRDRLIEAADGIIAEEEAAKEAAKKRCQQTEDFFTEKLRRWFDGEEKRETKTAYMVDLPSGKLTAAKEGKVEFIRDDDKLQQYLLGSMPEMLKVKTTVDWAELKKHITVADGMAVLDSTGEIVDGITVEQQPPEFKVKI